VSDQRFLLPASALGGGALLLGADLCARTLLAAGELPIGVVTASVGAPLFIYLLLRQSHDQPR
jgi:vitamin B12 transport system permease protein